MYWSYGFMFCLNLLILIYVYKRLRNLPLWFFVVRYWVLLILLITTFFSNKYKEIIEDIAVFQLKRRIYGSTWNYPDGWNVRLS